MLGAILLTGALALEPIALEDRLAPRDFYREAHALVYQAMLALHQQREPIDTLTVANQLAQHGTLDRAGGSLAVDELAGWVPAAGHARAYARIVRDHATRRALLRACYEVQQQALEGSRRRRRSAGGGEQARWRLARTGARGRDGTHARSAVRRCGRAS